MRDGHGRFMEGASGSQRADNVSEKVVVPGDILLTGANDLAPLPLVAKAASNYEECLACQEGYAGG